MVAPDTPEPCDPTPFPAKRSFLMTIVPQGLNDRVSFFEVHAPIWAEHAAQLSLPEDKVAELETLTQAARAAYDAAEVALAQAKSATAARRRADKAMASLGGDLIKLVRLNAEMSGDQSLYGIAKLPAPRDPSERRPVNPRNVAYRLRGDGSLELTWKGRTIPGTTYLIDRIVRDAAGELGPTERLAATGERRYVDRTVPRGATGALYRVSAMKGGRVTKGADAIVSFVYVYELGGDGEAEERRAG